MGELIDRVGGTSSSTIVSVILAGSAILRPPVAVPEIVTVLFGESRLLSTAVMVTAPVLVVEPIAIVSVLLVLTSISPFTAGDNGVAEIVTVVRTSNARSRLAVTVVELSEPLSSIDSFDRCNVSTGADSSSSTFAVNVPD